MPNPDRRTTLRPTRPSYVRALAVARLVCAAVAFILCASFPAFAITPTLVTGVEVRADLSVMLARGLKLDLDGTFSWSPSINVGEPMSPADQSVGKQLPYEPEFSGTATGRLAWRSWGLLWQFCYYSERYTMSSNDITLTGRLTPYVMNNLSLEKGFAFRRADLSLKATINNLFNEEYLSVLSRPMPRMNCEFFINVRPKWGKKNRTAK